MRHIEQDISSPYQLTDDESVASMMYNVPFPTKKLMPIGGLRQETKPYALNVFKNELIGGVALTEQNTNYLNLVIGLENHIGNGYATEACWEF